jgi:hypothetical protein
MENEDSPEDINIHKRIWGENADQVVYDRVGGKEGENDHFEKERVHFVIPDSNDRLSGSGNQKRGRS